MNWFFWSSSILNATYLDSKGISSNSFKNLSQCSMILTEGVMPEFLKAKNSLKNSAWLRKTRAYLHFLLTSAVKRQLCLTSFMMLWRCSGWLVIARMVLRWLCQRVLRSSWSLKVMRKRWAIWSKSLTIFRKWILYFYYLTSCSLIIFTSKVAPTYIFRGLTSSTLWICLSTRSYLHSIISFLVSIMLLLISF